MRTSSGSTDPPAVLFRYSPDRKGERPREHLKHFRGVLQADGYAGFQGLYDRKQEPLLEAACWAHARRKYFDLHAATASPLALEALERIAALYKIEEQCRGKSPTERRTARQEHAVPRLEKLREWLEATLRKTSKKSELAGAIRYTLSRWAALTRYCEDGRIEIDNSAAERALRAVALGRKNYLFAGSDAGGDRAAAFYSLIGSAKLNGMDPEAYLREVFTASPSIRSIASRNSYPGTCRLGQRPTSNPQPETAGARRLRNSGACDSLNTWPQLRAASDAPPVSISGAITHECTTPFRRSRATS